MKIYDNQLGGAGSGETNRIQDVQKTDAGNTGRTSPAGGPSGDRVELSGTLGSLSRTLSSFQSDRAARIQSLAAEYQKGTYRADSAAISRSMVTEALNAGTHEA
jgi:anti-sigma28 factor (negative regulator of flagellin synthesis)